MSREIHFTVSEKVTDGDWKLLISAIKLDFERVGKEKSAVLKSLEKWVIFPNKFVEIADICSDLHSEIVKLAGSFRSYRTPPVRATRKLKTILEPLIERSRKVFADSLQLSLLT